MDIAVRQVQANAKKVIVLQLIIAVVVALVAGIAEGGWFGLSALFGGFVGLSLSLLLRRGVLKANELAREDPQRGMAVMYLGAVQRFVLVLVLLGVGLGYFDFAPLAAIIGFGFVQVAYAVVMRRTAHPASR